MSASEMQDKDLTSDDVKHCTMQPFDIDIVTGGGQLNTGFTPWLVLESPMAAGLCILLNTIQLLCFSILYIQMCFWIGTIIVKTVDTVYYSV